MQSNGHARPTTGEPRGAPQANQVRLTVAQAAVSLGITEGAVRSRIKRGTLPTVKEGGSVYVVLGKDGTPAADQPPHTGEPSDPLQANATARSELVESLREQVEYLRGQLDAEREAGRRKDHIIAALVGRVPELEAKAPTEAAQGAPDSPVRDAKEADRGPGAPEGPPASEGDSELRSWWRRFFGF